MIEGQTKCFENMLDLINLTYFGTQSSSQLGSQQAKTDGAVAAPLKREKAGQNIRTSAQEPSTADAASRQNPPSLLLRK